MVDEIVTKNIEFLRKNLSKFVRSSAMTGQMYKGYNIMSYTVFYDENGSFKNNITEGKNSVSMKIALSDVSPKAKLYLFDFKVPFFPWKVGRKVKESLNLYNQLDGFKP